MSESFLARLLRRKPKEIQIQRPDSIPVDVWERLSESDKGAIIGMMVAGQATLNNLMVTSGIVNIETGEFTQIYPGQSTTIRRQKDKIT